MKAKNAIEAVWETVATRIGSNRDHGWKQADSMAAIEAAYKVETGEDIPKGENSLYEAIERVVNPSAFRLVLEKMKRPDGETILKPGEKAAKAKEDHAKTFAQFLS